jgi:sugar phosphate isomerase/epimerase
MQFAICNEIFGSWPLEDAFAYAAKAGYDAVEVAPFTIAKNVNDVGPDRRAAIRRLAQTNGIAISGIHWVLAQTEGLHLTHPDPAVRERTSRYLVNLVDFCADLSGRFMVVGSPKQRNRMDGVDEKQARDWTAAAFDQPARRAADRGVTICFEPLSPAETNFINTAADAIEVAQQVGRTSFKILLDVKAMSAESRSIPEIIRASWPHFAYFHANDTNLKGPGFGAVDFRPIAQALKEVGYDGFVSVEVFNFDEGPEVIATKSIEYLRRVFGAALKNV